MANPSKPPRDRCFWQHLFNPFQPNPSFQIKQDDRMIPAAKDESETIQYKQVMSGFLHACEIAYYDMVQLEPSQRFYGIKVKEAHSNHMFF